MFQKFNENNMLTKFIKNLLRKTYIPIVQIWSPGKPIIKDLIYITKNYIVKAKVNCSSYDIDNPYDDSGKLKGPLDPLDNTYFDVIEPYIKGKFYRGLTSNYISNSSNYDSDTHYYLGQYLRMIRDLDDIDLMQYYNCWNGIYSDKIRFKLTDSNEVYVDQYNTKNDGLKTLLVPIKFNKKYTIYIDSNVPFSILPIYYDGLNTRIDTNITNSNTYKKIYHCSMSDPVVYESISTEAMNNITNLNLHVHEDNLHLLIQIPESNTSHVAILEGDYSSTKLITILNDTKNLLNTLPKCYFGTNDLYQLSKQDFDNYFKSVPKLSRVISNKNYAFSDRLIEYLLLNVITKNEDIANNISRIQTYASSNECLDKNHLRFDRRKSSEDIWDRYIRKFNYDLATTFYLSPKCFDINGYVDKDTEEILLRGK